MISLLDTSLDSTNFGDGIIVRSILREFPGLEEAPRIPTHRIPTSEELEVAKNSELLLLTGTNILSNRIGNDRQWPLDASHIDAYAGKVVFLGVGWREYEESRNGGGIEILRRLRHPGFPVAARDSHSKGVLDEVGIPAVNTGCPTMWSLPKVCAVAGRSREVVFTLTDYRPDRWADLALLRMLARHYDRVIAWPQSAKDALTLRRMWTPRNVTVGRTGLEALDEYLLGRDYVGTRLHAGIRAAQLGRPILIVSVDNRAVEISRDTGLPVIPRDAGAGSVSRLMESLLEVEIATRHSQIREFAAQIETAIDQDMETSQ